MAKNFVEEGKTVTDEDFDTIAATGTFTTKIGNTVTFEPVEATHFRLVAFTYKSQATASKIKKS